LSEDEWQEGDSHDESIDQIPDGEYVEGVWVVMEGLGVLLGSC
jgi:hypothetical protein